MEESTQKNDRFSGTFRASEKKTNSDTSLRMVKECHMVDFVKKNRFSTHFFGWLRIGLICLAREVLRSQPILILHTVHCTVYCTRFSIRKIPDAPLNQLHNRRILNVFKNQVNITSFYVVRVTFHYLKFCSYHCFDRWM